MKQVGLAIGMGIGSSCIVLSSFTWGIFVFGERVHSRLGACFAVACLMVGLFGMSYYGSNSPVDAKKTLEAAVVDDDDSSVHSEDSRASSGDGVRSVYGGIFSSPFPTWIVSQLSIFILVVSPQSTG